MGEVDEDANELLVYSKAEFIDIAGGQKSSYIDEQFCIPRV